MKLSLERKITVGFGVALALVVAVGLAAVWNLRRFDSTFRRVDHTREVLFRLEQVLAETLTMQSSARGFVLTGSDELLAPYRAAAAHIDETLQSLRELTTDNATQRRGVDELVPVVNEARQVMADRIASRHARGLEAGSDTEAFLAGERAVERLRVAIESLENEETRLLRIRFDATHAAAVNVTALITAIALASAGLAALAAMIVRRDFAERKLADERLRASEERWRLMVGSVQDYAIIMLDPTGRIVSWNSGASRIKGYTAGEIVGQHYSRFYPAEGVAQKLPEAALERSASEGRVQLEGWRVRKDGTRFWGHVVITAVRDDNRRLIGFVKVTRDLTERRAAEEKIEALNEDLRRRAAQLEAANRELEAFSYSVSHDLRAPLRHVDGYANLLSRHAGNTLDLEGKRYLGTISRAAKQMGTLIDDLLAFSRIGRAPLHIRAIDQNQLVAEIIAEGRYGSSDRPIEWHVEPLPDADGDSAMLRQVWRNLLDNAVKYSGKVTAPRIVVGGYADDTKGEKVFFVRDNGVGFDMAYADKLFGVFQRLHGPAEFEGTGIGLANVRRIVSRHQGRTWAESRIGEGATFYFSLPLQPSTSAIDS